MDSTHTTSTILERFAFGSSNDDNSNDDGDSSRARVIENEVMKNSPLWYFLSIVHLQNTLQMIPDATAVGMYEDNLREQARLLQPF
jgi:hypothetical protein